MAIELELMRPGSDGGTYPVFKDDLHLLPPESQRALRGWMHIPESRGTKLVFGAETWKLGRYWVKHQGREYQYRAARTVDNARQVLGPLEMVIALDGTKVSFVDNWTFGPDGPMFGHTEEKKKEVPRPRPPNLPPVTAAWAPSETALSVLRSPSADDEFSDGATIGVWGVAQSVHGAPPGTQTVEILKQTMLPNCEVVTSRVLFSSLDGMFRAVATAKGMTTLAERADSKEYPYQTLVFRHDGSLVVRFSRKYKELEAALTGHEQVVQEVGKNAQL